MSNYHRTQRHKPPPPSRWLLLMKVVIAIGQVVSLAKYFVHFRE